MAKYSETELLVAAHHGIQTYLEICVTNSVTNADSIPEANSDRCGLHEVAACHDDPSEVAWELAVHLMHMGISEDNSLQIASDIAPKVIEFASALIDSVKEASHA